MGYALATLPSRLHRPTHFDSKLQSELALNMFGGNRISWEDTFLLSGLMLHVSVEQ